MLLDGCDGSEGLEHLCGFSLGTNVLATVPSGEPPSEETRNKPRSVNSPGEQAERGQASTCAQVVATRVVSPGSPNFPGERSQGRKPLTSGAAELSSSRTFCLSDCGKWGCLAMKVLLKDLGELSSQVEDNASEQLDLPDIGTY